MSYWFEDGISESGTGLVILLIGMMILLTPMLQNKSGWKWLVVIAQPLVIVAAFYGVSKLVKFLKERITYPRTGYVSYPRRKIDQRIKRGILAGSVAAAVSIGVTLLSGMLEQRFVPLFISILLSVSMLLLAVNYGAKRFYILCVLEPIIGAILFLLDLPDPLDSAWLFMGTGIIMILVGVGGLFHYLHNTQPASPEEME